MSGSYTSCPRTDFISIAVSIGSGIRDHSLGSSLSYSSFSLSLTLIHTHLSQVYHFPTSATAEPFDKDCTTCSWTHDIQRPCDYPSYLKPFLSGIWTGRLARRFWCNTGRSRRGLKSKNCSQNTEPTGILVRHTHSEASAWVGRSWGTILPYDRIRR